MSEAGICANEAVFAGMMAERLEVEQVKEVRNVLAGMMKGENGGGEAMDLDDNLICQNK